MGLNILRRTAKEGKNNRNYELYYRSKFLAHAPTLEGIINARGTLMAEYTIGKRSILKYRKFKIFKLRSN